MGWHGVRRGGAFEKETVTQANECLNVELCEVLRFVYGNNTP
jgi:hypothetical protein